MTTPDPPAADEEKAPKFGAADVVDFVLDRYELGRTTDGVVFVIPTDPKAPKTAKEIRGIRSEVSRALWRESRITPGREAVGAAIETLIGLAEDAPVSRIYLRAAEIGASVHVDLADRTGCFVEISAHGWEVRDPVKENDADAARAIFRRTAASGELPAPAQGGSRDDLRDLLGLAEDDPRWRLVWGWLVAACFESVPRPILWALGPQGSGKSTRARMVLSVIEPTDALGREPGKNERDDTTAALGRFVPSWDNIGTVSAATSDWLCRLTTGVEIGRRALYTDDDLRVSTLRRTAVATSIVLPFGLGADALERLVLVEFERVAETDRRPERELWSRFRELQPRILGALFDDVAGVLRHLPEVRRTPRPLPRMADYAQILYALDEHAGEPDYDGYAAAYVTSVRGVLSDRAKEDPLTAALLAHVRRNGGTWRGAPAALLAGIDRDRPDDPRAPWPTSPASIGSAIRRGQETLRAAGLIVSEGKSNGSRWVRLDVAPTEDDDAEEATPTEALAPAEPITAKIPAVVPERTLSLADVLG
ncbi:hypothetical protein O7630_12180 [Micromonospora sp. WMMD718]|uniref:hypothetical protein n=1 Tax=Micromonospora sp. WMMD718 TaxID=3016098 RepID=UPI002415AAE8|nr:hypothetical protein [Micromonospora sp. WMMD718]MDG4751701.1 hypothetical protein [Micromonospora sp. WMMD718]